MNAPLKTVLVLLSLSIRGSAQTLGEDTCSCSPGTYEITFDFSLVCPPTNVTVGDGIEDIACLISPTGVSASNDLVPVSVEAIDILEGGENLNIIFQDELIGPFSDGDTFTYTTNIIEGASDIRKGIQFSTYALNQAGESIVNVLNIVYTNDCNVYPVIDVNQSAGWFRFVSVGMDRFLEYFVDALTFRFLWHYKRRIWALLKLVFAQSPKLGLLLELQLAFQR